MSAALKLSVGPMIATGNTMEKLTTLNNCGISRNLDPRMWTLGLGYLS